jgi:hypothetical protein
MIWVQLELFDDRPVRAEMSGAYPVPVPSAGKVLKVKAPKGGMWLTDHPVAAMYASWAVRDYALTFGREVPRWVLKLPAHECYWLCAHSFSTGIAIEDWWEAAPFR